MNAYFETGFETIIRLTEEFTKQFPNVTWDIKQDQFANLITTTPLLLASDNPPDIIRLPTFVTFAKDGLLMNLDDYATAFGWNDWPVPLQFARLDANGIRGSGTLYAMGLNYQLTGVFYNKKLAAQIGMTEPPSDSRRVRCPARQGKGRRTPTDHGVGQRQERHGARFPASAADGSLWPGRSDQRLDLQ